MQFFFSRYYSNTSSLVNGSLIQKQELYLICIPYLYLSLNGLECYSLHIFTTVCKGETSEQVCK